MTERSMLDQPKTTWVCTCGATVFEVLLCPKCKGEDTHIVGFKCVGCETVHTTIGTVTWEEDENTVH